MDYFIVMHSRISLKKDSTLEGYFVLLLSFWKTLYVRSMPMMPYYAVLGGHSLSILNRAADSKTCSVTTFSLVISEIP